MAKLVTWKGSTVFLQNPVLTKRESGRAVAMVRLRWNDLPMTAELELQDGGWHFLTVTHYVTAAVARIVVDHVRAAFVRQRLTAPPTS